MNKLMKKIILSIIAGFSTCIIASAAQTQEIESLESVLSRDYQYNKTVKVDSSLFYNPHQFSIYATPGYGALTYKGKEGNSVGNINCGVGFDYTYWITKNIGISVGLEWMRYVGSYKFDNVYSEDNYIDYSDFLYPEGNPYTVFQLSNMAERQISDYLQTPIKLQFSIPLSQEWDFRAAMGVNMGWNVNTVQKISGEYTRYADFPVSHVIIDDSPTLGLGTYDTYSNPTTDKVIGHTFGVVGEIGADWKFHEHWLLNLAIQGSYGINDVKLQNKPFADLDGYSGVITTNRVGEVHTMNVGIKVGIAYRFGKSCYQKKKDQEILANELMKIDRKKAIEDSLNALNIDVVEEIAIEEEPAVVESKPAPQKIEQPKQAIDIIEESDSYYTSDDKRVEYIYHVIVGSYANVKNAYNVSKKFSEKGMNNYVAVSDKGLHRIFYYSSDNVDSVIEKYKEAKKSISDAWILKLKKN